MPQRARVLAALLALVAASACTSTIVLRRPPSDESGTLGPLKRCEIDEKPCRTDPDQDTSRFNIGATRKFFSLPTCQFGVDRILVQQTGASDPVVIAQCAAPPQTPIGSSMPTTSPGGGTVPAGIPTTAPGGGTTPPPP
jgi:hypothetical protein